MAYHWPNIPRRLREYMPLVPPEDMTTSVLDGAVARLKYADSLAKYNEEGDRVGIRRAITETFNQYRNALERRKTDEVKYKPAAEAAAGTSDLAGYTRKLEVLKDMYGPLMEKDEAFRGAFKDAARRMAHEERIRARLRDPLGIGTVHEEIDDRIKMPRDTRITPAPKGKLTTGLKRHPGSRIVSFRLSGEPGAHVVHEEVWDIGIETYRHGIACDCPTYVDRSVKMPPDRIGPQASCPHTRAHIFSNGDVGFLARFASSRPGWVNPNGTFPPQRFVVNLEWEKPTSRKLARADVSLNFCTDREDPDRLDRFARVGLCPGYNGSSFGGDHNDGIGFENYFTHNLMVDWQKLGRKQLMIHVEERLIMLGLEPCPECHKYGFNDVDAFDPDNELHRWAAIHRGCQYLHREVCRGCDEVRDMIPDVDA